MSASKLSLLRNAMRQSKLNAYIIPSSDAHMSEYICSADMQREYISNFTGSNGTAVVTESKAALWTDGRYFLQADKELSDEWILMKQGVKETPSIPEWITKELPAKAKVGLEAQKNSYQSYDNWKKEIEKITKEVELIPVSADFFSSCWPDRPPYPSNAVFKHPICYSGQTSIEKVANIRSKMAEKKAEVLVVSALDEVAWLLNIRGSDIDYNPVAISYVILTMDSTFWFIQQDKVPQDVKDHVGETGVIIQNYENFIPSLATHKGKKIWFDPSSSNIAIVREISEEYRIADHSPLSLSKAVKNETEIQGLRNSCLRDSAAIVEYFCWLEKELVEKPVTEWEGAARLARYRSEKELYVGESFATISSSGANAAVIHYHPLEDACSIINPKEIYLCDSGAQYYDGTTDVTRTVHFGEPTVHEKRCFTRVLQGHFNLAKTSFPHGTLGRSLDPIARLPLWSDGLDFLHGTGHGVGSFLNVHEPPTLISSSAGNRGAYYDTPFVAGMTVTIEPGYYEDGAFGIRIENDYIITKADTTHQFQGKQYYTFENLTWVPIQPELVDKSILSSQQIKWVNEYNQKCSEKISGLLSADAKEFLARNTKEV